ncbi:hypothetical protein [Legionella oakridgensis]|uniref:Lipase n=2 Tax=Legionella oakridgensis TaxID=29423 RepID=W0BCD2_9GAMM|nr:hypothetical protein [Legionella oakridgensis]AHE66262.1 hypothetical protein Loa_00693 [Legionella oakridgensis ATCC 33761 = DSM 21215]ETO93903.1 alpha/beta hydrolase family [Legionella oakridgensis RV-2-2007]KTD37207.1 hypothetical protein Loak_2343 [Legionella oakridgensis]STY16159.1 Uncharacterised protein [Legionella longbeachae]
MRTGEHYAGGLAIHFFESSEFETGHSASAKDRAAILARNVLRLIMMGWRDNWTDLISWQTLNAVLVARDPHITRGLRFAFQEGFKHVFSQLQDASHTALQRNQAELFINNCLMYLPYADINPYESFAIPQWLGGRWQLVDYKVVPIELTPTVGFETLVLSEYDRVFAYGLEPIHHPQAEPHLLFMGTTYPAGQGFYTTVNTDLEAFETAGKKLYRSGRNNIRHWLESQTQKVHVCGTSLGGALSLLLAIDQGDRLSRVDALNPPGLHDPWLRKSRFDHWDELAEKPEVYIQRQGNDPISRFGVWKTDWHLLHVIPPPDRKGLNRFTDHALNYAGYANTQFLGIDTEADNKKNQQRNIWLYGLLRSAVYYTTLVPVRYGILPAARFAASHKLQTGIILLLLMLFLLCTPTLSLSALPYALLSIISVGYLLTLLLSYVGDQVTGRNNSDLSQFLAYLGDNPKFVQHALFLCFPLAIMPALGVFVPGFLQTALPSFSTTVTVAPLAARLCIQLNRMLHLFSGREVRNELVCHRAELERHPELDIYANTVKAEFTYKEIHAYYRAKRCVLKGKPFLPDTPGKLMFFSSRGVAKSKHELLREEVDAMAEGQILTLSASKAKIHEMKKTLKLVSRHGFHTPGLKAALEESYQAYLKGKNRPLA